MYGRLGECYKWGFCPNSILGLLPRRLTAVEGAEVEGAVVSRITGTANEHPLVMKPPLELHTSAYFPPSVFAFLLN
jgi:hypothetical protein